MPVRYNKLTEYLNNVEEDRIELTYSELSNILKEQLPVSLINGGITQKSRLGLAILKAGFVIESNSYKDKLLILNKNGDLCNEVSQKIEPAKTRNKIIFLNVVFPNNAGYLSSLDNIGHEIIDIFGGDNNEYHYYLNPYGLVDSSNIPDYIISICHASTRVYKILNLAVIDTPEDGSIAKKSDCGGLFEKQKEKFKYNDKYLEKYFESNIDGNTVLSSFKCKGIYEPKHPIYLTFGSNIIREGFINLVSTTPGRTTNFKVFNQEDQNKLEDLVSKKELWNDKPIKTFKEYASKYKNTSNFSYFKVLGIEDQELQYSNAIRFFLNDNDKIKKFLTKIGCKVSKEDKFFIERENYNIDLLFTNFNISKNPINLKDEKIIIIENKIKANVTPTDNDKTLEEQIEKIYRYIYKKDKSESLNDEDRNKILEISSLLNVSIERDKVPSQLSKYYIYAVLLAKKRGWDNKQIKNNIKCFFLCPEYSKYLFETSSGFLINNSFIDKEGILFLQEKYKLITYKKILPIFKDFITKKSDKFNTFLSDFVNSISKQAKDRDDLLEQKMIEMFYLRSINN